MATTKSLVNDSSLRAWLCTNDQRHKTVLWTILMPQTKTLISQSYINRKLRFIFHWHYHGSPLLSINNLYQCPFTQKQSHRQGYWWHWFAKSRRLLNWHQGYSRTLGFHYVLLIQAEYGQYELNLRQLSFWTKCVGIGNAIVGFAPQAF